MSKNEICNRFNTDIDQALNSWLTNRVIPYSNAYSTALVTYNATLAARERTRQEQAQLMMIVATVVFVAAIEFAPIAATIAGGTRLAQGAVLLRVANVIGRNTMLSRTAAYRGLKNFTFGPLRNLVNEVASGPGKARVESFLAGSMPEGSVGGSGGGTTQSELQFRNSLESTVRTSALGLQQLSQLLRDTPLVDEQLAQQVIHLTYTNSPFLQKSPAVFHSNHPLAGRTPIQFQSEGSLAQEMEKTLWATWCLGLEAEVTRRIPSVDEFGVRDPNGGSFQTTEFSDAGGDVLSRMQQLQIKINGVPIKDYVGWIETDSDVQKTIQWAKNHLRTSANRSASARIGM